MFLRKVHNAQSEIIRNYQLIVKDNIKNISNNHVKRYIRSCLNQSIKLTENYYKTDIEISPLIGFYAILNLAKVHVVIKSRSYNLNIHDINQKFRTHGASSTTIEKIRLSNRGTFSEFANLYYSNYSTMFSSEITLNFLYSNISDLYYLYQKIYNNSSNYIKSGFSRDILLGKYTDVDLENEIGLYFNLSNETEVKSILDSDWYFNFKEGYLCASKKIDPDKKYVEYKALLTFSLDNEVYLKKDQNYLNEKIVLYLLFLKYSSLVRYQPKNWSEKIESKEFALIDKINEIGVLKFWSLLYNELSQDLYYII